MRFLIATPAAYLTNPLGLPAEKNISELSGYLVEIFLEMFTLITRPYARFQGKTL